MTDSRFADAGRFDIGMPLGELVRMLVTGEPAELQMRSPGRRRNRHRRTAGGGEGRWIDRIPDG